MRVVSGTARGTKLQPVPGDSTRPILDRVKTALFDSLRPKIEGARILDLFAGSGSVGIEALSQGAEHCVFIDSNQLAVETIKSNLAKTKLVDSAEVRKGDAFSYLRSSERAFDLIYIAPPQYKGIWLEALMLLAERPERVSPGGLIIVQIDPKERADAHSTQNTAEPEMQEFELVQERKYGNTLLLFFERRGR
jgi:16S rRNA (guanine966-N2)-methyltransferase